MWLCAVSCREMLPDPSFFAQCMRDAFAKMQEAAAREAAYTVAEAAAIAAPGADEHTIEGKVVRRVTRKKAARRPRKAAATASPAKRRVRNTKATAQPAPDTPA
jgi:hypothetical protein